jgi:hypothetical protein
VARSIEPKKEKLKEAEARRYGKTMGVFPWFHGGILV